MNISCDVMSNPPATMLWRRERFTISAEGTPNTRIHSAEGKSVLEVGDTAIGLFISNYTPQANTYDTGKHFQVVFKMSFTDSQSESV